MHILTNQLNQDIDGLLACRVADWGSDKLAIWSSWRRMTRKAVAFESTISKHEEYWRIIIYLKRNWRNWPYPWPFLFQRQHFRAKLWCSVPAIQVSFQVRLGKPGRTTITCCDAQTEALNISTCLNQSYTIYRTRSNQQIHILRYVYIILEKRGHER